MAEQPVQEPQRQETQEHIADCGLNYVMRIQLQAQCYLDNMFKEAVVVENNRLPIFTELTTSDSTTKEHSKFLSEVADKLLPCLDKAPSACDIDSDAESLDDELL